MDESPQDFETSHINTDRRRRRRRLLVPTGKTERALYLNEIAKRLNPNLDFFLFSFLTGLVIGLAILLDNPAIYILAALLAPFMAPVVALGFSASVGSLRFFAQSVGSLLLGSAIVFLCGMLSGWISRLFSNITTSQTRFFTTFSVPGFILLIIGAALAIYLTVRVPKQRSLVASVALAYAIYIPVGVAGFGLTSAVSGLFPEALKVAGVHLFSVLLVGALVLILLKLRPFTFFGYLLTAVLLGVGVYTLIVSSALGSALQKQMQPFIETTEINASQSAIALAFTTPTETPQPAISTIATPSNATTPTNTVPPTRTATITITPKPTPVWAMVFTNNEDYSGVIVRKVPAGEYLTSLLNGQVVQVLPDTQTVGSTVWAHIILEDGREGWIARHLLMTATPVPGW
jgi:hypothetical protein